MATVETNAAVLSPAQPLGPSLRRRVATMALSWLALGIVVGVNVTPNWSGTISLLAGAIAGMTVLLPIGILLGLLGGRWKETIVGAALGQVVAFLVSRTNHWGDPTMFAAMGLIYGGLIGATVVGFFYRLPRFVLTVVRGAR